MWHPRGTGKGFFHLWGSGWKRGWTPVAPACALSTEMRQCLDTHQKPPGRGRWCQRGHKSSCSVKALGAEAVGGEVPSSGREMPPMLCHVLGPDLPPRTNLLPWHGAGDLICRVSPSSSSILAAGRDVPFLGRAPLPKAASPWVWGQRPGQAFGGAQSPHLWLKAVLACRCSLWPMRTARTGASPAWMRAWRTSSPRGSSPRSCRKPWGWLQPSAGSQHASIPVRGALADRVVLWAVFTRCAG